MAAYTKEQKREGKREGKRRERRADVRTLQRVAQAFSPYKWRIILVILAITLATVLGLVDPFLIRLIFDDAIGKGNVSLLILLVSVMLIVPILTGLVDVGQTYLSNSVGQYVMRDFRSKLYAHVQSLPLRFFTVTRAGEVQSRLSNDVSEVQDFVTYTAPSVAIAVVSVLSTIIAMTVISPLLTVISLGVLPIFVWVTQKAGHVRRTTSDETQNSVARLTSLLHETLSVSGILLMKTHARQDYARERFDAENQTLTELEVRQQMIGRWLFMLIGAFFTMTPAIVYLVAGLQIIRHPVDARITVGGIVAFTALQSQFFFPVQQLLHVQVELQGALALFDRIFAYLDLPVEIQDAPDALRLRAEDVRGRVTFDRVSFTYKHDELDVFGGSPGKQGKGGDSITEEHGILPPPAPAIIDPPVHTRSRRRARQRKSARAAPCQELATRRTLDDISFDIQPGRLAALVGPSGAGKTTITYLAPRLYDVDSGSVAIDGHNVKQIALASLGELIGVVTQETYLFHASIKENLLYARPDATDQELVAAAKAAAIHERVMELPDQYDTIVGERGYKLSGGEKQRLAIARVILKDPRILILDEATSALDTHSERLIQAALAQLMKNRTTLAIAHRLSTILAADIILVVDRGQIVERGSHKELLARGGLYARLYNEQFAWRPHKKMTISTSSRTG
jgi:ATP-binding cassette, subfamily B, bacterial